MDDQQRLIDALEADLRKASRQRDYYHDAWKEAQQEIEWKTAEIDYLRVAMKSIADNTCCDSCQEAALVATEALKGEDDVL
jgi:uncharacterized coiled-coil DUF342 family protein